MLAADAANHVSSSVKPGAIGQVELPTLISCRSSIARNVAGPLQLVTIPNPLKHLSPIPNLLKHLRPIPEKHPKANADPLFPAPISPSHYIAG
eukprot:g15377.t1